jgi:hypothetical protein
MYLKNIQRLCNIEYYCEIKYKLQNKCQRGHIQIQIKFIVPWKYDIFIGIDYNKLVPVQREEKRRESEEK